MIRKPLETSIKVAPEFWKELLDCSGMLSSTKLCQRWPRLDVCWSVGGKITKVKQAQNLRDFQMMVLACLLGLTVIIRVTVSLLSRTLRAVRNPSNFTFSRMDTRQSNFDRKKGVIDLKCFGIPHASRVVVFRPIMLQLPLWSLCHFETTTGL